MKEQAKIEVVPSKTCIGSFWLKVNNIPYNIGGIIQYFDSPAEANTKADSLRAAQGLSKTNDSGSIHIEVHVDESFSNDGLQQGRPSGDSATNKQQRDTGDTRTTQGVDADDSTFNNGIRSIGVERVASHYKEVRPGVFEDQKDWTGHKVDALRAAHSKQSEPQAEYFARQTGEMLARKPYSNRAFEIALEVRRGVKPYPLAASPSPVRPKWDIYYCVHRIPFFVCKDDSCSRPAVEPAAQAAECVRCNQPTNSGKVCHLCKEPLCDIDCEDWHLEKDCPETHAAAAGRQRCYLIRCLRGIQKCVRSVAR